MRPTAKTLVPYYQEIDLTKRETERTYVFPGGDLVRLVAPKVLIVSDNGHRIVTADGVSHYIPYGWIHLWWTNHPERPEGFYCREQRDGKE